MVSKKHYIKMVELLRKHNIKDINFINDLCLYFEEQNENFNKEKFKYEIFKE